jgi:ribosomal subunit interface protein
VVTKSKNKYEGVVMLPLQLTIRDMTRSEALQATIRKKAEKLKTFYDRITSCRVIIDIQQKHKHQGKLFNIRIDVTVPGKELVSTHKNSQDIYIAIREGFNAISRQLEEHSRKRHGHVKAHNHVNHGYVTRIVSDEGYGFIEDGLGDQYYFSVTNTAYPTFEKLMVGDAVEFVPESVSAGLQAHHVIREHSKEHAV